MGRIVKIDHEPVLMTLRQFVGRFDCILGRTCENVGKIFMLRHYGVVTGFGKITEGSATGR